MAGMMGLLSSKGVQLDSGGLWGLFLISATAEPFFLEPRGGAAAFTESLFQLPWKYSCDLLSP